MNSPRVFPADERYIGHQPNPRVYVITTANRKMHKPRGAIAADNRVFGPALNRNSQRNRR